ncbi:MAG: Penicillin amidase family protein [uncultured Gemmatimonadaceae bacterium]|uniref:Penicillin amidase family protein n=1 Tax=uncultured Gemmatimonadaceae bacterium TaxID=246130 RepID=A0A6J4KVN2_9BACT|nr:MAG: Penicillin amidase family protein [uncultured Gemmatimonadaceae bacterium]
MRQRLLVLTLAALGAGPVAAGLGLPAPAHAQAPAPAELARLRARAQRVTIIRDTWGVPHVYGKSDADAVFGLVYAQAEDDFNRVELNYINAMGRLAEVEGEAELWRDLRMKLFIDPADMRAKYARSPAWLQQLMTGWADGLNFYLATHPQVKPKLLTRFEPWMALTFSEGSIGGDIETVSLRDLEALYGPRTPGGAITRPAGDAASAAPAAPAEPGGSNGFAIAPANTANGRALLLINPHTSFYFRPEVHVASEQGLNAYGAVTWGQFFVYQGFNDRLGWMHTSGGGDVIDEYLETIVERGGRRFYKYGAGERPLRERTITLPYRLPGGGMGKKVVTAYFSHHGPIVRAADGKWVAVRLMQEEVKALSQSYLRTKARSYAQFAEVMNLRTNSSNNTVYADADGTIAYWHGNFVPARDTAIDFDGPVDGSDPRTEWKGLHRVAETITLKNPATGFIQNTNNSPWRAAGAASPDSARYPRYMNSSSENPRGAHALRVLAGQKGFTLDKLIAAAYDSYLTAFEPLVPALVSAYDAAPAGDTLKTQLAEQVALLRAWDRRFSAQSVPTSLAVYWGDDLMARVGAAARAKNVSVYEYMATGTTPRERLEALARASARLTADFGTWKTPWGEINRFQRLTGDVVQPFDDAKPSLPVPFASATWGSLAAYGQTGPRTTKRIYGNRGNSFVAAVEFGPRVTAKSVLAGGVSGDPASPHFADQAERYARGEFKDVRFYRADVERGAARTYRPGDPAR